MAVHSEMSAGERAKYLEEERYRVCATGPHRRPPGAYEGDYDGGEAGGPLPE